MTTSHPVPNPRDAAQAPDRDGAVGTVGVVIPVFNRATLVLEALKSVLAQTLQPEQVLIVDDGSTDGTAASVRAWQEEHPEARHVALVEQSHAGVSTARNTGFARVAHHGFVAFLDSDDRWPADFLERTQQRLSAEASAVAASCDRRSVQPAPGAPDLEPLDALAADATSWLFSNGAGVLSCSLLRTAHVRALGGFEADLLTGQDWALLLRLSTRGPWLHCAGDPVAFGHGLSAARGERDHLRKAFPDYKLRWVRILERWLWEHGGAAALPGPFYRSELAQRWSQAARQLLRTGRAREARAAFRRSVQLRPRPRTLFRLLLAYLRP